MKKLSFTILLVLLSLCIFAQITSSATGSSGSGYAAITNAGFDFESPDCVHQGFGAHITQIFDEELDRNVFVFHSHVVEDNDRCQVFDRVRMEIKGGPNTAEELQHVQNSTSFYRWKFRLSEDFMGVSSFNHIFQNKIFGGSDSSFPLITITLRANVLEVRHAGGDTGNDLGRLAEADLDLFRGKWIEGYIRQVHGENGELEVTLRDMTTGITLLEYTNNNIDLWRTGAEYSRPKWGMYRLKNTTLQDEEIRFADFCVSETSADLCPAEVVLIVDTEAPTTPANLQATDVSMTTVDLEWEASTDAYGVTGYDVLQEGTVIKTVDVPETTIENLTSGTTYNFTVRAKDEAGNQSELSNSVEVTTDAANALPDVATSPAPGDGATNVNTTASLSWTAGNNTDSYQVYFGTQSDPPLVSTQTDVTYQATLNLSTTYFWQIISTNVNGTTTGPIWTFTTGSANPDAPWLVYRANERLDIETNFFTDLDIPSSPTLDEVVNDPNGSVNKFYNYQHEEEEKFRWRYELAPTDTAITVEARLKALNDDVNCICYFEIKAFGWREKLRMNQSTIKLERSSPVVEENIPFEFKDAFHLIRVTMSGNEMNVYLDQNPVPIAVGNSIDNNSNALFEFGKSGSPDCGASIDWIAILGNQNNAPNEGPTLPADLFLSSDATLSSIQIDGVGISGFSPGNFEYDVSIAGNTMIPVVTYTTGSDLATAVTTDPVSVPNTAATITVTAQDGFTQKNYTINYTATVSTSEELAENGISIFPNPTSGHLYISSVLNDLQSVKLLNAVGIEVFKNTGISNLIINTHSFPTGIYYIFMKKDNGSVFTDKIFINK